MPEKKFEVHLEAPGIGEVTVLAKIIAIPHGSYYDPQYQIVGATPEDAAKLCQIKDVQAFLDYSKPGALSSNAEHLTDALGGIAASSRTVEGLPDGAQLNVSDDKLRSQARQAITDTIDRCKATLRDGRAPDVPADDDRPAVPGLFRPEVFGGAGVAPVTAGPNDQASLSPAPGTRNFVPAASPVPADQMGDRNIGDWQKSAALPASSNINPSSVRELPSPMLRTMPADPNQPSQAASPPLAMADGAPSLSAPTASPAATGIARAPSTGNPVWDWWNGLVADVDAVSRKAGYGGLNIPMPNNMPALPTQPAFDSGLPGLLARAGALDPPAGGLLGLLQEHMRNNPDDDASAWAWPRA